jgi:PAS domain S-box-containing protein
LLFLKKGNVLRRIHIPVYENNKFLGSLYQYQDVTIEKQRTDALRQSEDKYRGIIENMELGLLEVDNHDIITKPYPRFCDMLGYQASELIGRNARAMLLPEVYHPILEEQAQDRKKGNAGVYEVPLLRKNGDLVWTLISGAPVFDILGNVTGSIGIHYDVSKQKKLNSELELSKKIAEEAQEAEKQFLANMSHEIRTPLNAIIGMTHLLSDTSINTEQAEYLEILKNSAEMLRSLISDILDLSKIRAGKMEPKNRVFELRPLLDTLVRSIQFRMGDKPIHISSIVNPNIKNHLLGDELWLNQILLNLLSNAEKFTSQGNILLKVDLLSKPNENPATLQFVVSDTGIGIPKDKHDFIFQTFRQVDGDTSRRFGGTGLGLAITKNLVDLQKGTITVKSNPGTGSQFIVTLKYEIPEVKSQSTPASSSLPKMSLGNKLILVVEDNYMNRRYIGTLLQKWGATFHLAVNGHEAIVKAKECKYDAILMDIQMPEIDGYEAALSIRTSSVKNQHTPIIALSADTKIGNKEKLQARGIAEYISKPFLPAELFTVINQLLYLTPSTQTITNIGHFNFHPDLNHEILQEMYQSDVHYTLEMMEVFEKNIPSEVENLHQHLLQNKYPEAAKIIHKIKSSFTMVGLTTANQHLEILESVVHAKPVATHRSMPALDTFMTAYKHGIHLIRTEIIRLKQFIQDNQYNDNMHHHR